jgi:DNA-binding NarL/FixJ family response regulator
MIKVIIAEDHALFREGLLVLLESQQMIEVVGEAANGHEALELVVKQKPDVVVTDIEMPGMDGIELTKELATTFPGIAVVALTMYEEDYLIIDMLESGARGYLLKNSSKQKLVEAISAVHSGGMYFCESTSLKLMKKIGRSKVDIPASQNQNQLTELEVRIVNLVCREFSSKEIAEQLNLGVKTIESYRNKIYDKMGVRNMAGLVIYAIKHGYFNINEGKYIHKPSKHG